MKLLTGDKFYLNDWAKQVEYNGEYCKNLLRVSGLKPSNGVTGININIEGWYSDQVLRMLSYNIIDNTLMEAGIGPDVGFMGASVIKGSINSKLYAQTLKQIEYAISKVSYNGPVSMYCTIYDDEVYIKSILARINQATIYVLLDMLKEDDSFILDNIHTNLLPDVSFLSNYGVGFLLAVPPFPYSFDYSIFVKVNGINNSNIKHIWLHELLGDEVETYDGVIGVVTARGDTVDNWNPIRDARRRIFRTINNLHIPNLMYRRDIGVEAQTTLDKLKDWL